MALHFSPLFVDVTVKQGSGKPTAVIPAQDYGMGNAANVLALAQSLLG